MKFISTIIFIVVFCLVGFSQVEKPKIGVSGNGTGRGQGNVTGISTQNNKAIVTAQNEQGVVVISKPKPNYTDVGRQKGVSGRVVLRVTFQSNGEVGEVVYVGESSKKKKLTKYGLVTQAIEAAKKIKFEPARENGLPITVTKTVEYSFTIY